MEGSLRCLAVVVFVVDSARRRGLVPALPEENRSYQNRVLF